MSVDFKQSAQNANNLAANINTLKKGMVSITDAQGKESSYLVASEGQRKT